MINSSNIPRRGWSIARLRRGEFVLPLKAVEEFLEEEPSEEDE